MALVVAAAGPRPDFLREKLQRESFTLLVASWRRCDSQTAGKTVLDMRTMAENSTRTADKRTDSVSLP